jgi:hypothetical protein
MREFSNVMVSLPNPYTKVQEDESVISERMRSERIREFSNVMVSLPNPYTKVREDESARSKRMRSEMFKPMN